MSIQFNDNTNYKGLVQLYEKELGFSRGDISGNTARLKEFTADANLALDDFWAIAIPASGKWQLDDSNHTDYPIIRTNITSGTADYPFTVDETNNLVLDIYKVFILPSATATEYVEISPVDQQSEGTLVGTSTYSGVPDSYDKTANAVFLNPKPNYSATNGLKVMINREASYFTFTDTTKKPGVDGRFHAYFYLKPALEYARRNNHANERKLKERVLELEQAIEEAYSYRGRDERKQMSMAGISFR